MNDKILITKVGFDKISDVSAFLAGCWKSAYKDLIDNEYLSSLKDDHWIDFLTSGLNKHTIICIAAESENKIIGISIFGKSITELYPSDGEVISLYIKPEMIGRGVGHLLFEKSQRTLKEQGYEYCIVCVFSDNINAIQFYKSHGFDKTLDCEEITIGRQKLQYMIMRKRFWQTALNS